MTAIKDEEELKNNKTTILTQEKVVTYVSQISTSISDPYISLLPTVKIGYYEKRKHIP